jgi:orotate phosphoribosyltransferase
MIAGGESDTDIVQISRVFHTGADPMERIATRAEFEGLVTPRKHHILVDDVTTMEGTLAELANFIQDKGGLIAGVLVLANAGRLKNLRPKANIIQQIDSRHGLEIENILHITPSALTANEASYLIGFRTTDEIRNRLAKARQETDRRLRSKSIER